jgi:2-phosphosulfolactate phosphatase
MSDWLRQEPHGVRFGWGPAGAEHLAPASAGLVIVDVLSFSTAVTVAVEAGIRVFPYPRHDDAAAAFARRRRAVLAAEGRSGSPDAPWSLSPAALRRAPFTPRLVLPSPNGSAIAATATAATPTATTPTATAAATPTEVVAACLRNAIAAGRWLAGRGLGTPEHPVAVIAAGERWPDGSLRPALEDLLGAGAVIAALTHLGAGPLSPEAAAASGCYEGTPDITAAVAASVSGRELSQRGFPCDVVLASEVDTCDVAAVLADGAFEAAG